MVKPEASPTEQLMMVLLEDIDLDHNIRERVDEQSQAQLAANIRQRGVLTPIILDGVGPPYRLLDGRRRVIAAKQVGLKCILSVVRNKPRDVTQNIADQVAINDLREPLTAIELAKAFHALQQAKGATAAQVAEMTGYSPSKVSRLLALLVLPEEVQQQVHAGTLPASTAVELAQMKEPERAVALQKLTESGVTRDQLAGMRRRIKNTSGDRDEPRKNPTRATAVLGTDRSVTVSSPELDLEKFIDLLQEALEKARKARPQGVRLGTFLRMLKEVAQPG